MNQLDRSIRINTYDNKNDIYLYDACILIKNEILKHFNCIELKLFGSYALNNQLQNSDIDIFIVYNNKSKIEGDKIIADIMTKLNIELRCMVSIVGIPSNKLQTTTEIYNKIQKEGINI